MSSRLLPGIATVATAMLVSCYPYPEAPYYGGQPPLTGPSGPQPTAVVSPQQREMERQREAARQAQTQTQPTPPTRPTPRETAETRPAETQTQTPPPKPPETVRPNYPVAMKVVGREGFVISPYNKKQIDVSPFASGTLVRDPTYPEEEKKFFRVP